MKHPDSGRRRRRRLTFVGVQLLLHLVHLLLVAAVIMTFSMQNNVCKSHTRTPAIPLNIMMNNFLPLHAYKKVAEYPFLYSLLYRSLFPKIDRLDQLKIFNYYIQGAVVL